MLQESISPTLYERICANILAQIKSLSFSASTKKLSAKLTYEKAARKMLVKLTPGVNFTNISRAAFAPISLRKKKFKLYFKHKKALRETFMQNRHGLNVGDIGPWCQCQQHFQETTNLNERLKKLRTKLLYETARHQMLVKLTTGWLEITQWLATYFSMQT